MNHFGYVNILWIKSKTKQLTFIKATIWCHSQFYEITSPSNEHVRRSDWQLTGQNSISGQENLWEYVYKSLESLLLAVESHEERWVLYDGKQANILRFKWGSQPLHWGWVSIYKRINLFSVEWTTKTTSYFLVYETASKGTCNVQTCAAFWNNVFVTEIKRQPLRLLFLIPSSSPSQSNISLIFVSSVWCWFHWDELTQNNKRKNCLHFIDFHVFLTEK